MVRVFVYVFIGGICIGKGMGIGIGSCMSIGKGFCIDVCMFMLFIVVYCYLRI